MTHEFTETIEVCHTEVEVIYVVDVESWSRRFSYSYGSINGVHDEGDDAECIVEGVYLAKPLSKQLTMAHFYFQWFNRGDAATPKLSRALRRLRRRIRRKFRAAAEKQAAVFEAEWVEQHNQWQAESAADAAYERMKEAAWD